MKRKSILCDPSDINHCNGCGRWLWGTGEWHHTMNGTHQRKKADEDGLIIYVCGECHRRIHQNALMRKAIKKESQIRWMKYYNKTEEEFIKRYGRSYLGENDG